MPQPRHPVIIYTHSPKVIHTQPKDFMALVQKLTGFSRPAAMANEDGRASPPPPPPQGHPKPEPCDDYIITEITNRNNHEITDNDSTSVVTDEKEGSSSVGHAFDAQNNRPPFGNCVDSLLLMRSSISSSSSSLESVKDLPDF
nr:VQ motif-containing protein 20-like [Ipomoea batatas]